MELFVNFSLSFVVVVLFVGPFVSVEFDLLHTYTFCNKTFFDSMCAVFLHRIVFAAVRPSSRNLELLCHFDDDSSQRKETRNDLFDFFGWCIL